MAVGTTAALIGAAGTAASGALQGATSSPPNMQRQDFNGRSYINVAPVGLNLGEILRQYKGPPENGGLGLETTVPPFQGAPTPGFESPTEIGKAGFGGSGGNVPFVVILGLLGVGAYLVAR
mgnify:CR=1 FL=1